MRQELRNLLGLVLLPCLGPTAALAQVTPELAAEAETFAVNNVLTALYHEFGHLFIDQFELPILTREEDAADAIATLMLLNDGSEASLVAAYDTVDGYFMSAQLFGEQLAGGADFTNPHGLDVQRAYQMTCLLVGGEPASFESLAGEVGLPPERLDSCAEEYATANRSWSRLVVGHLRGNRKAGPPVAIIYEAGTAETAAISRMLQRHRVLEQVAETITAQFILKSPASIRAVTCGEENAYYDLQTSEITLCYEYAQFYYSLLIDPAAAGQVWAEDGVP